jgi:putative peptidoglycan lipid II flippase
MTVFLLPWAALAVPLATSAYPGLSERAEVGDEPGYRRTLAPVLVLTVVAAAVAAAGLVAVSGPLARVFFATDRGGSAAAMLQPAIVAFAPGLLGYALVALLARALYARGLWRAPTACVTGGWLVAAVADVVLARALPPADRALALGAGHSIGVTVGGVALLVVVARVAGAGALAGLARTGLPALLAAVLGAAAGLQVTRWLGADPVPADGLLHALAVGALAGGAVLVVAAAVMMGTARRPLTAAVRGLRATAAPDTRDAEVAGG